jgi:hypothetical protein
MSERKHTEVNPTTHRSEEQVDDRVEDTFPASDPPASTGGITKLRTKDDGDQAGHHGAEGSTETDASGVQSDLHRSDDN